VVVGLVGGGTTYGALVARCFQDGFTEPFCMVTVVTSGGGTASRTGRLAGSGGRKGQRVSHVGRTYCKVWGVLKAWGCPLGSWLSRFGAVSWPYVNRRLVAIDIDCDGCH
jgi:hypothetical protein